MHFTAIFSNMSFTNVDENKQANAPVEGVAGVIIKSFKDQIVDIVGVSNSPIHAATIADQFQQAENSPDVIYTSKTVKMFVEHAI